jgi:hypothetical protein
MLAWRLRSFTDASCLYLVPCISGVRFLGMAPCSHALRAALLYSPRAFGGHHHRNLDLFLYCNVRMRDSGIWHVAFGRWNLRNGLRTCTYLERNAYT